MTVNYWIRTICFAVAILATSKVQAQDNLCKDSLLHRQLLFEMWAAANQDDSKKVYDACKAMQKHARAEGDRFTNYTAAVCGVLYDLGRMNISHAYHIAQMMAIEFENDKDAKEESYFIPNMMGHVYNTCGNIPGAMEEFKKSEELIKGTRYEAEGLGFVYLALAHTQLNNDLEESLKWIDMNIQHLEQHKDSWNYYRGMADANAMKAIVKFKQRDFDGFRKCMSEMEAMEGRNPMPSADLFVPYARIYQTLLDGDTERALVKTDSLKDVKEQYMLKCDIYRYIGDNDKAFQAQRELMYKRDSIAGVMIAQNIQQQEKGLQMMKKQQDTMRLLIIVLFVVGLLAIVVIVFLVRYIRMYRRLKLKTK